MTHLEIAAAARAEADELAKVVVPQPADHDCPRCKGKGWGQFGKELQGHCYRCFGSGALRKAAIDAYVIAVAEQRLKYYRVLYRGLRDALRAALTENDRLTRHSIADYQRQLTQIETTGKSIKQNPKSAF